MNNSTKSLNIVGGCSKYYFDFKTYIAVFTPSSYSV